MAFNGSGTFVINSSGQPVVANTVISTTVFNALTADLATGLSTCITKDGQTTPTANIPMGTFKFTNLGVGSAATDSATLGQVQASTTKLITVTGTDTITGTLSPALTAYTAGQMFYFVAGGANTGAVTLNIDGLGARNMTRHGSVALVAGDILSGEVCVVVYDGTRFQLLNPASYTNLNVTGVLALAAGTALLPSLAFTGDTNTGLWSPAADTLAFSTNGGDRVRIDSSGRFGIGTEGNALTNALTVYRTGLTQAAMAAGNSNTGLNGTLFGVDTAGNAIVNQTQSLAMLFSTNNTERMRLDTSGNLGIGTASPTERLDVRGGGLVVGNGTIKTVISYASEGIVGTTSNHALLLYANNAERARITSGGDLLVGTTSTTPNPGVGIFPSGFLSVGNNAGSSGFVFQYFVRSATTIGTISQNGTTAVLYNTTSDARLKENITPAPEAGEKIDAIQIVSHDWKSAPDERVEYGVIAQDLHGIAPQAVNAGDNGEEVERAWGVDYSKLVPMLVKEVQSLRKRVAELESK